MFDWIWKGIAGVSGVIALWYGVSTAMLRRRMEQDKKVREDAFQRMTEKAFEDLKESRKKYAGQAPINPNKRTEFE